MTNIADLKSKGFVIIDYPKSIRDNVEKTVQLWKGFCAIPTDLKMQLPYSNDADGVGYELKFGNGYRADRKENFDITLAGHEWLKKNAEKVHNKAAYDFIESATNLITLIKPVILNFAMDSEKAFGIKEFSKEVASSENNFFIRFIHYFGNRNVGEEIASAHVDQSGYSLHLFESDPGLQCLTYERKWTGMPVSKGKTVIIPSMQMQLRSNSKLKALCHRVIATKTTAGTGRFSAVCFIQFRNTPKYDKRKYGRLQEKEPGFNYAMEHKQFSKLFK